MFTLLFFWEPLGTGQISAPLDMFYDKNPWNAAPPTGFRSLQNAMMEDISFEFYPIRQLAWSEWRAGRVPLWNPYILTGVPLLGADQYAVFDPLNLLTLPFPFPVSWLLVSMARVFLAGLGTYLLLLRLRLHTVAATFGAVAYMFSSGITVWLYWSHSDVACYLPWLCWAIERLVRREPSRLAPTFVLALLVGGQFLAGHIEISAIVLIAASVYALWRGCAVGVPTPRRVLAYLSSYAIGVFWGIALGAVQLLPAILTVLRSAIYQHRSVAPTSHFTMPWEYASVWLVPNLFGNQALGFDQFFGLHNYNEQAGYAGLAALLAACWSWRGAKTTSNRSVVGAMVTLIALAAGLIYGLPGFGLLAALPPLSLVLQTRFALVACFALAVLGALGVQGLFFARTAGNASRSRATILATALGALPIAGVAIATRHAQVQAMQGGSSPFARLLRVSGIGLTPHWLELALRWTLIAALIAGAAWLLFCVGLFTRPTSRRIRAWAAVGLVALAFGDLFLMHGNYNPSVPPAWANPASSALRELQSLAGTADRITASREIFAPNTNMYYRLRDLRGLEPVVSVRASRYITSGTEVTGRTLAAPSAARLSLANIAYFLTEGSVPGAKTFEIGGNNAPIGEIHGPIVVSQQFTPVDDGLQGFGLLMATYGHHLSDYPVIFSLTDRTTGRELLRRELSGGRIPDNRTIYLAFPPLYGIVGHTLELRVSAPAAQPGDAPLIWSRADVSAPGTRLFVNDRPRDGTLCFKLYSVTPDSAAFEPVWTDYTNNTIWRNTTARPRAYLATRVERADTADEALQALPSLISPAGAMAHGDRPVVVEGAIPAGTGAVAPGRATILRDVPGDVTIETEASGTGFVVLTEAGDPGWRVTVDGRAAQLHRTNYLFQGAFMPPGRHVVRFYYLPPEYIAGVALSGGALLIGVVGALLVNRRVLWSRLRSRRP